MRNAHLIQLTLLIAFFATGMLSGQCPEITSSTITPGACTNTCLLCPGDEITITVEGFDLPDPGTVDFYVSNNAGFNPYANQGTFIGSSQISTPGSMPCDACPTMEAIMVNACGFEQANEFIMMGSGSGFAVNELTINLPNGGFCGFANSPNTGVVTGCNVVGVGPGGNVPPGAVVVILVSSNANQPYDFSASCPNGETIYVLQNSCALAQPAFRNSCTGCGPRTTTFSLGCGCSGGITYFPENLMNLDGEYVLAGGTPGHVPCNGAPPVTVDPPDPTPSTVVPFSYTIPASWCDQGPREIVGILNPGSTPPCLDQFTERFTIDVRCPTANSASGEACDNGNGTGTFDLTALESIVNGGSGNAVNWYSDMNGNNPISSPYTTGPTTIWATVLDGCESDPVPVTLTVLPLPQAQPAGDEVCETQNGEATFPLTNLDNFINGGTGREVRYFEDAGATLEIFPPYTTGSTTIYATVFDGQCSSTPVPITLIVLPAPPAVEAVAEACDDGSGQALFDLGELEGTVNGGNGNLVSWFEDPGETVAIQSPYLTASTVVYAVVSDGICSSDPVEVTLTVIQAPGAFAATETICDDGSGMASFDLTLIDDRVTGGGGGAVSYYMDEQATQELVSPFLTGSRVIYARVELSGCVSEVVAIELRVLPAPPAQSTSLTACGDGSGIGVFDLSSIEGVVNEGTGFDVEWALDPDFLQGISSPYTGPGGVIYARVFNGGCYSPVVEISLMELEGPRLDTIRDTTVCGALILPVITGDRLSGNEAFFWRRGALGDTLMPGDTIRGDTLLYIYDRSAVTGCEQELSFRVVVERPLSAGNGRSIAICDGTALNLYTALDSADGGGFFRDLNMSGRLLDSLFDSGGLSGQRFTFSYVHDSIGPCPADSSLLDIEVVTSVSAGEDIADTVCAGEVLDLFGLLENGDLGGSFTALDPGPVITNGRMSTGMLPPGTYGIRYLVGDGVACPLDSSLLEISVLASPVIDPIGGLGGCGFVVLPGITGTQLPGGLSYGTMPGGTGTQFSAGDTIFQSGRLYVYAENGRCSDEQSVDIRINDHIRTNVRSSLCPGGFLEVGGDRFDVDRPSGEVVFAGMAANGCDSIVRVELAFFPEAMSSLSENLCFGESVEVNGRVFDVNRPSGSVRIPNGSVNGCDSTVYVDLTFEDYAVGQYRAALCPDEFVNVNGSVYDISRPSGRDTLDGASASGCDSIVEVELVFFDEPVEMLERTLCPGEFVMVNNTRYDEARPGGMELIPGGSADGCDSTVVVELRYWEEARGAVRRQLCFGQSVQVNGVTYDESNPSGVEVLAGQAVGGCDSIVEVDLAFSDAAYNDIQERLCAGDFLEINGIRYDASNLSGVDTIPRGSVAGCDSIIRVSVSYLPVSQGRVMDTLCPGESVRIGGEIFTESNPTGTVTLANAAQGGCDSLVEVRLSFTPIQLSLPAQYTVAPGQVVTLGLVITGSYASILWEPSEGLSCTDCLNPVASPGKTTQYKVTVVGTNGCIAEAFTTVRIDENFKVFLPNAFSPNGDGVNDRWVVETNEQIERILYVRIFDRWGTLVYSEVDVEPGQQRGWDGRYGGKELNPAVFVVVASVQYSNGGEGLYTTDVSLLR
jgi:gliding motility-associated-like protein